VHGSQDFLEALAMVLCVAAVTTVLFQRFRQPVVLGYILAGLIIGPHVPIPLVADAETIQTLSEVGVILLMFSLGLEFSLRRLFEIGATAGLTAIVQCSMLLGLGFVVGRAFGWTVIESMFAGAIIAISSTTIIAKAFDEQNVRGKPREIVVGILIAEDLIAILLMAILTGVASGSGLSPRALVGPLGQLAAFLIGVVVIGLLVIPRIVRSIMRLGRAETTLVASLGICFAVSLLAYELGYSVALGAFLAGSLVAESGEQQAIEHLVQPVRDVFAAVFFVSVGMGIDPALIAEYWFAVLVFTVVVIVGKVASVALGVFLTGNGTRASIQAGLSLAQIGEFSFIIAALGLSLNATGEFLYPIAVAVSAITTLTTPFLIRASEPVASYVDRRLPRPLQTLAVLYASWVEQLRRASPRTTTRGAELRRRVTLAGVDVAVLGALAIGTSIGVERMSSDLEARFGWSADVARAIVIGAAAALSVPFCIGVFQRTRGLGAALADVAFPASADESRLDLAAAPRRSLVLLLQLASLLLLGAPLVAVLQPFVPPAALAVVLGVVLLASSVAFWRSATNLQSHVSAGAQLILEALQAQSHASSPPTSSDPLHAVKSLVPGLGAPTAVRLLAGSPSVGRSLAELNLRGVTGATVLVIQRGASGVVVPQADHVLQAGDVLALAGAEDAIASATALLIGGDEATLPIGPQ
jgi:monovalent cation:H+ antiporter-2, CPA2 family